MLIHFKIPTLLGLSIIIVGLVAGLTLVFKNQTFLIKASPDITPLNITTSNIEDSRATISWQTSVETNGFITFGKDNTTEQTVTDDRDNSTPKKYKTHHVTLKNLTPKTTYLFTIVGAKKNYSFSTASSTNSQNNLKPIIGSVSGNGKPLNSGIVYLTTEDAVVQSTIIKNLGNFIIPIINIRTLDLSQVAEFTQETVFKLKIIGENEKSTTVIFTLKDAEAPLGPFILGQDLDLTAGAETSTFSKFDLNRDGLINSSDYAMISKNKVDLNSDGVVNQKDLDLMQKQMH